MPDGETGKRTPAEDQYAPRTTPHAHKRMLPWVAGLRLRPLPLLPLLFLVFELLVQRRPRVAVLARAPYGLLAGLHVLARVACEGGEPLLRVIHPDPGRQHIGLSGGLGLLDWLPGFESGFGCAGDLQHDHPASRHRLPRSRILANHDARRLAVHRLHGGDQPSRAEQFDRLPAGQPNHRRRPTGIRALGRLQRRRSRRGLLSRFG
jgi:hypothetical protein